MMRITVIVAVICRYFFSTITVGSVPRGLSYHKSLRSLTQPFLNVPRVARTTFGALPLDLYMAMAPWALVRG